MIRRKVAERLQARRRAATGGNSDGKQASSSLPSSSTPDAVFSVTKPSARQNTEEGFLFVDDRDAQSDSADDIEDHEALRQAVADDISGFEVPGALDGDDFESENREEEPGFDSKDPPPRPKLPPQLSVSGGGRVRAGAMSIGNEAEGDVANNEEETVNSKPTESKPALKPWQKMSDKEIYEQQLVLMQDQLTSAMIEKEELKKELEDLKAKVKENSRKELRNLVKENRELSKKLESATGVPSKGASVGKDKGGASRGASVVDGRTLTVEEAEDGFDRVSISSGRAATRAVQRIQRRREERRGVVRRIKDRFYDFLADFTEEVSTGEEPQEEPALAAKKLKNNLQRLSRSSRPWTAFGRGVQGVLQWQRMAETLVVFLIYMYCVWSGWIMQVTAFIAIVKLSMNYLYTSGLAEQFGFPAPVRNFTPEELKFKDKIHVVKTVAQTVQNRSGQLSDALEKLENLFLWYHPEASKRLYTAICSFFLLSLILPNRWTLTLVGIGVGIKLFIIDNVYRKYPKVKAKYDTVARLWKELPTNEELVRRQALTEEQLRNSRTRRYVASTNRDSTTTISSISSTSSSSTATSTGNSGANSTDIGPDSPSSGNTGNPLVELSEEEASFCSRFQFSPEEVPLAWWHSGRRCSLLDRSRPLSLTKSGKLFLTHSYLCFERVGRAVRDPERIIISLKLVKDVVKAKPFAVLPGSGMSIEVTLERGDKFTFSAMLNRDQAYRSILDQGMILGLPWGSDPIGDNAAAVDGEDDDEKDNEGGNTSLDEHVGTEDGLHDQQDVRQ